MNEMRMHWKQIWENKGKQQTDDLRELNGFENTTIDSRKVAGKIVSFLEIKKRDRVLEVGCGAGMIAQYLDCDYVGLDYSESLLKRHVEILGHTVVLAEASNIPFKDDSFDKLFAYSVFHYFPNKEYANQVVTELKRVCKGKVFIGDLPIRSRRREHLLFNMNDFCGDISDGFYDKERFNILLS